MTNMEIGSRISECRREAGMTMDALAKSVGVAKSTIQRYEAGKIEKVKLPVIESIANALNVNPSWIIGKSNDRDIQIPSSNQSYDLKAAFFGGIDPTLSKDEQDAMWEEAQDYMRFKLQQRRRSKDD